MADPIPTLSAPIVTPTTAPPAPAEPIALELKAVEQAFVAAGNARFLDLSGRFSFEDRSKLVAGVADLAQKTGAKVYVLALPGKTDVNTFAAVHADLKLSPRDVFLIFSADKRHLHSQAIPKSVGNDILKDTNKEFYRSQTSGVLQMFDEIAKRLTGASTTASTAAPSSSAGHPAAGKKPMLPMEYVLIALAIGVIAWLMLKTNRKPQPAPARKSKPAAKAKPAQPPDDAEA